MFQTRQPVVYVPQRHGPLHGLLTGVLVLWAIAFPALLVVLSAFGPIGFIVGVGAGILLVVPWLVGLVILAILRAIL
jgi:hypothetical protein